MTSPDESGLTLYDEQRSAVFRKDGRPVSMTWKELLEHDPIFHPPPGYSPIPALGQNLQQ